MNRSALLKAIITPANRLLPEKAQSTKEPPINVVEYVEEENTLPMFTFDGSRPFIQQITYLEIE